MGVQLTVRLPHELNARLKEMAERVGLKRSDLVRMAIQRLLAGPEGMGDDRPYEKVQDLIGVIATGVADLGERHRDYLLQRLKRHA
ncbi:MAG: ribbon-helix-helix domain-containing protein [Deltaproteobacteria bacterium]|nr:ribbon-helix-helix domain-containing protein [Deltaproteobacteria bacterium]